MMRRFWRKLRSFAVAVLIGTAGLACGLAGTFRAYDMSAGKAQLLGTAGAVLVATGAILLLLPRKDQRVPSLWENAVSHSALGEGWNPLLCRRHVTTRAQGRMLGCNTTADALTAIDWLHKRLVSVMAEMIMEDGRDLKELAEQARLLAGLHKCIGAVGAMRFMADFKLIARHADTPLGVKAAAIINDLSGIATQVGRVGVEPLDQLFVRLWREHRNVHPLPDLARGEIQGVFTVVKRQFPTWGDDLASVRDVATLLHDQMRQFWEEDRRVVQEDSECTPQNPQLAMNVGAAAEV